MGDALPDTVRLFAVVAIWSYGTVAGSGLLVATVTLDGLKGLDTAYGVPVRPKIGLLVRWRVAGWLQRRTGLATGVDSPERFGRLALAELALMAFAVALGVAPPARPQLWVGRWCELSVEPRHQLRSDLRDITPAVGPSGPHGPASRTLREARAGVQVP